MKMRLYLWRRREFGCSNMAAAWHTLAPPCYIELSVLVGWGLDVGFQLTCSAIYDVCMYITVQMFALRPRVFAIISCIELNYLFSSCCFKCLCREQMHRSIFICLASCTFVVVAFPLQIIEEGEVRKYNVFFFFCQLKDECEWKENMRDFLPTFSQKERKWVCLFSSLMKKTGRKNMYFFLPTQRRKWIERKYSWLVC